MLTVSKQIGEFMRATTEQQVYSAIKNNGHVKISLQPTEAQLRYYAKLVIQTGARFELGRGCWSGRTKYQMSMMIDSLVREHLNA